MSRKIITWAVAALFAVPACSSFASVKPAHKLVSSSKSHKTLISTSKKHRTLHHKTTRHTGLVSSARAGRHLSSTIRPATTHTTARTTMHTTAHTTTARPLLSRSSSSARPQVHVTSPVTIDGMHT